MTNDKRLPPGIVSARHAVVAMTKVYRSKVKHKSGLTIRTARLDRARPVQWAWDLRVLLGYLNLLIGEEGIGKSTLVAWIAARITRGELPGDLMGTPRPVAFIGDEDAWEHVWVPRLEAAGADLGLTKFIDSGPSGVLDVKHDADNLREYIEDERVGLVYFDQLLDNLGYTDTWKDKQVRDTLAPLRAVAQSTGCALLASMHPNKRGGSFRDQISGTPAFNALSRSGLLVARHPDEPDRKVVVRGKGNFGPAPEAFEFRIEEHRLRVGPHAITTSRVTSTRETALRADDVLDVQSRRQEDSKAGQARRLLAEMFANGEVRPAREVLDLLRDVHGIGERPTQRARNELGIDKWQEDFQGPWFWGRERPKIKLGKRDGGQ